MSDPYNRNYNQGYPPQGYPPQEYGQQQGGYAPPPAPSYGNEQPQYGGNYGPPAAGGFQHGQQGPTPSYDAYGGQQRGDNNAPYGSAAPSQQYPQSGPYDQAPYGEGQQPGQEGDRGLMGALAGGAAGYYGGHKMGHGFIGTLAGAWAGSKLEDAGKEHKLPFQHQQGYGQGPQQGYGGPPQGPPQGGHHHHHHNQQQGGGW